MKKNSEHHTSIQWDAEALAACAEFRKMAAEPGGPARPRRPARGCGHRSTARSPRARSRSGPRMATESFVLKVLDVVEETADAHSIVFEVPDELAGAVRLHAGPVPHRRRTQRPDRPGGPLLLAVVARRTPAGTRSPSSAPSTATPRTGSATTSARATPCGCCRPSGIFTPRDLDADLLLFAGGSGITPVMSITRTALEKGHGKVVLFYANRDESSVIFAERARRAGRRSTPTGCVVVHWLESVQGLPTQEQLRAFASYFTSYTAFVCGPGAVHEGGRRRRSRSSASRASGATRRSSSRSAATRSATSRRCRPRRRPWRTPTTTRTTTRSRSPARSRSRSSSTAQDYSFDDWQGDKVLLEFLEEKGARRAVLLPRGQLQRLRLRRPRGRGAS